MASRNDFEIVGLKELVKAFDEFGGVIVRELNPKVDEAGNILLQKTREKVSVRSGKLRDSLHLKRPKSSKYVLTNVLTWGNDVRAYGAPLELGHRLVFFGKPTFRSVAPRPFLRPAADEVREKVFETLIEGIDNALEKIGGMK